jgi:hypothetical protein
VPPPRHARARFEQRDDLAHRVALERRPRVFGPPLETEMRHELGFGPVEPLAVDQHAVAVEDHEFGRRGRRHQTGASGSCPTPVP